MKLIVANGPNLQLLGSREPEIYGRQTLADIEKLVRARAAQLGCEVVFFQTNHEGEMLDRLVAEAAGATGIVINPGALIYQSYALYDCLKARALPVVEVHITNLYSRAEAFRSHSLTAPATTGVITGLGSFGYLAAMEYLIDRDQ